MHGALLMRVMLVKIGCKRRLEENKVFGVIVGAINDVVDATHIMEVTGREKSRGSSRPVLSARAVWPCSSEGGCLKRWKFELTTKKQK